MPIGVIIKNNPAPIIANSFMSYMTAIAKNTEESNSKYQITFAFIFL